MKQVPFRVLVVLCGIFVLTVALNGQTSIFECRVTGSGSSPAIATPATVHAVMVYSFAVGESTNIQPYLLTDVAPNLTDYFARATFGQVNFQLDDIIRQDSTHGIQSRVPFDPRVFGVPPSTVVTDVLQQADALYDFGAYDNDGPDGVANSGDDDGIVDLLIFQFLNYADSGACPLPTGHTTNDARHGGGFITVSSAPRHGVNIKGDQRDVSDIYDYMRSWCHELGHAMFSFPDMEHQMYTDYAHYATGAFDVMANGSFNRVPSPYNPWFVDVRGWRTFTGLSTDTLGFVMSDFFGGGTALKYQPASLPSLAYANERFYLTYHRKNPSNPWTYNWPVKTDTGGLLRFVEAGVIPRESDASRAMAQATEDTNESDLRRMRMGLLPESYDVGTDELA